MSNGRADWTCPDCDSSDVYQDTEDVYECTNCGLQITESERIKATATTVRGAGFDDLANRLEAAAERAGGEN